MRHKLIVLSTHHNWNTAEKEWRPLALPWDEVRFAAS